MSYIVQLREEHKARLKRLNDAARHLVPEPHPQIAMRAKAIVVEKLVVISDDEYVALMMPEPSPLPTKMLLRKILQETAKKYSVPEGFIVGDRRTKVPMNARREFCYRAVNETIAALAEIGRFLGGRDHATVVNAAGSYCQLRGIPFPRNFDWQCYMNRRAVQAARFTRYRDKARALKRNYETAEAVNS